MPRGTGRKKIEIKRKEKDSDRMVTFSKRRKGLFKKVHQLHSLSGHLIGVLVFSPAAGRPFVSGPPCFDRVLRQYYRDNNNINDNINNVEANITCDENCCGGASTSLGLDVQKNAWHNNIEEEEETGLWMSWLATLELGEYDHVDELLVIKNDLEFIRDRLIKRAAASSSSFNN